MISNGRPMSYADCQNVFKIVFVTILATVFIIFVLFTLAEKSGTKIVVASDHLTIETVGHAVDQGKDIGTVRDASDKVTADKSTTKVIVLGYKRGGTSFFGQLLHMYPKTQYLFEPLVGVYSHMYGGDTVPPWSIRAYSNGTIRNAPDYEVDYIVKTLGKMFDCNYDAVHVENFKSGGPVPALHSMAYRRCMKQAGFKDWEHISYIHCDRSTYMNAIPPECINPDVYNGFPLNIKNRGTIVKRFKEYNSNSELKRKQMATCIEDLRKNCTESNHKVFKLIRMNMKTAIAVLEKYPDVKVIHYIRDPRAIQNSRVDTVTSFAFEERMTLIESSKLLCDLIWNDIQVACSQPLGIAKRILQVRYEDVVEDPEKTIGKIDEFLERKSYPGMLDWLRLNTNCPNMTDHLSDSQPFALCKNASYTMDKWRNRLNSDDILGISETCSNVLDHFKYPI